MKLKHLILTIIVLAGLCLLAWFLTKPPRPAGTDPRVGQPLVTDAIVTSAAQLKLTENGKTVLLKKQPDDTWQVASYYDFPADFSKLAGFVHDLTDAKVSRFVTANPGRFSRLEFKDSAIALLDANGKALWSLTLGKTADSGGRFVHFGDEKRAYLTKLNAWIDPESRNWADSALLHFKPDDIARVEIDFPGADAVMAQRAKVADAFKADAPAGQQLKVTEITNLLRSLGELRFTDTTAKDDAAAVAAAQHQRTLKLTAFGGATYTIALGRTPESKQLKAAPPAEKATGTKPSSEAGKPGAAKNDAPAKPAEPVYETIPAGPVFAVVTSSDAKAPINHLMQQRAFKVADYAFTSLPGERNALFEPVPPPPTATPSSAVPTATDQPDASATKAEPPSAPAH